MVDNTRKQQFEAMHNEVYDFLYQLTAIPSIANEEEEACEFVYQEFSKIVGAIVERQYLDNSIKEDPLWCTGPYFATEYTGHFNVIATWKGTGEYPPFYVNAHIDTITPCCEDLTHTRGDDDHDTIHGLGVHDDKGHVAIIYALFKYLSQNNVQLPFDVIAHLVVEEEIGGNGTLWAVRHAKEKGQCAMILDGNEGTLMHYCRGCVWPYITTTGVSCHPGDRKKNKFSSAYDYLVRAIEDVRGVYEEYCAWLKDHPVKYFEDEIPPMNVSMIHAGNWPSSVPTTATTCIVLGVFPHSPESNMNVRRRVDEALANDPILAGHYKCEWVFDVMAGGAEIDDPLVTEMQQAMKQAGMEGKTGVFNAACDIGLYAHVMGVPVVNCGTGTQNAHSMYESIKVSEVTELSHALANWLDIRSADLKAGKIQL